MARTIQHDDKLNATWGDEDHLKVAQERSFVQLIFELISDKTPTPEQVKLLELILNLSIDHGPETPSAVALIQAAQEGKSMSESVAAGLTQINERHGAAVEPAMKFLYRIKKENLDIKATVKEYLEQKKLIGGFGHRIYTVDPRTQLILEKMKEYGVDQAFVTLAQEIEQALQAEKLRPLPLNIDGAIAVVLCTFGWDSHLGNAVFIIARTPGLCGQYLNHAQLPKD